ncbi:hypothetical protein, partial [Mycobacterium sp.]|uniref:hypothetical protein n=1 Tax=Mycobacterium sp. TaxID=1785 RepID=UPI003BB1E231
LRRHPCQNLSRLRRLRSLRLRPPLWFPCPFRFRRFSAGPGWDRGVAVAGVTVVAAAIPVAVALPVVAAAAVTRAPVAVVGSRAAAAATAAAVVASAVAAMVALVMVALVTDSVRPAWAFNLRRQTVT